MLDPMELGSGKSLPKDKHWKDEYDDETDFPEKQQSQNPEEEQVKAKE